MVETAFSLLGWGYIAFALVAGVVSVVASLLR